MHLRSIFNLPAALLLGVMFCCEGTALCDSEPVQWADSLQSGAGEFYDAGFVQRLMKKSNNEVALFDMDLIENDAPGSGESYKGVDRDTIWGDHMARKILSIDDTRTHKAYLVVYNYQTGDYPLSIEVNGKQTTLEAWDVEQNYKSYIWKEFPGEWLREGDNTFTLSCPDADGPEEGWVLYLSRADEFEQGGGDPAHVGETSFKSTNGGKSWKESPFGPSGDTRAEYAIRVSMDRYVKEGWLASPVIDIWRCGSEAFFVRQRRIRKLDINLQGEVPGGTHIRYYIRRGTSPDPYADTWEDYRLMGEGAEVQWNSGSSEINPRYIQIRAVLSTDDPRLSPVFKSASVRVEEYRRFPIPELNNIGVISLYNPEVEYSSYNWEWESWDRPEFQVLRERENLDEYLAGARTQFEKQVRLLEYASERWNWTYPVEDYPEWDALSIVNRINKAGGGGMCIQHNNFLAGLCMAYGWQARLVNMDSHEVCEVWNDDLAKWIYLDASYNHYLWDAASIEPLSLLDIHRKYLEFFYPGKSIRWKTFNGADFDPATMDAGLGRGSLSHHFRSTMGGFFNAAFMRLVPRNNWYEKPYPRPATHGMDVWPWNGYVNWYDDQTPPLKQYTWYTDRKRDLWPTLNTVHIHATSGPPKDRLFLEFETYTPNFSHFEVNTDDAGWRKVPASWTWLLRSGRNKLQVRSVSKMGVTGKPSVIELNYADVQFETTF